MCLALFLAALLWPAAASAATPQRIRQILIEGNQRMPTPGIVRLLSSTPGTALDEMRLKADIKELFDTGLFKNVEVQTRAADAGRVDVIYHVDEYPFISAFVLEGVSGALDEQIRNLLEEQKVDFSRGTPFRPHAANRAALLVGEFLRLQKYPNAEA